MKAIVMFVFLGLFVFGISDFALSHESSHHSSPKGDLGVIHFPTSGNPEAQEEFLQGVLLLHNFQYDEAKESFLEAQKRDPEFAMAYWGEAMTENHPLWQE